MQPSVAFSRGSDCNSTGSELAWEEDYSLAEGQFLFFLIFLLLLPIDSQEMWPAFRVLDLSKQKEEGIFLVWTKQGIFNLFDKSIFKVLLSLQVGLKPLTFSTTMEERPK